MRTRFYKKNLVGYFLWSASQCVFFIRPNTLLLCFFLFVYFSCSAQIHKLKFKSEYYLRINIGNPAISLWFPKKWLFGFFIFSWRQESCQKCDHRQSYFNFLRNDYSVSSFLEKRLASQYMFLIKSELSIITYLFLVFYKSTSL